MQLQKTWSIPDGQPFYSPEYSTYSTETIAVVLVDIQLDSEYSSIFPFLHQHASGEAQFLFMYICYYVFFAYKKEHKFPTIKTVRMCKYMLRLIYITLDAYIYDLHHITF